MRNSILQYRRANDVITCRHDYASLFLPALRAARYPVWRTRQIQYFQK